MSCNRENVIWPSRDGTWNRAFYDYYPVGDDSPDWDHEWGVEYTDEFNWVRTKLPTLEAAQNCWDGANPGGWDEYPAPSDRTDDLDAKAAKFLADNPPEPRRSLSFGGRWYG